MPNILRLHNLNLLNYLENFTMKGFLMPKWRHFCTDESLITMMSHGCERNAPPAFCHVLSSYFPQLVSCGIMSL